MSDPLPLLLRRLGSYQGHGINHEDQPFHGELVLSSLFEGSAVGLRFRATGIDGTVYHDERTWIARAPEGGLALWTLSTNAAMVMRHDLMPTRAEPGAEATLSFVVADPEDRSTYRSRMTLDLLADGRLGYRFAWGLPGEAFAERSQVVLTPGGPAVDPPSAVD